MSTALAANRLLIPIQSAGSDLLNSKMNEGWNTAGPPPNLPTLRQMRLTCTRDRAFAAVTSKM